MKACTACDDILRFPWKSEKYCVKARGAATVWIFILRPLIRYTNSPEKRPDIKAEPDWVEPSAREILGISSFYPYTLIKVLLFTNYISTFINLFYYLLYCYYFYYIILYFIYYCYIYILLYIFIILFLFLLFIFIALLFIIIYLNFHYFFKAKIVQITYIWLSKTSVFFSIFTRSSLLAVVVLLLLLILK